MPLCLCVRPFHTHSSTLMTIMDVYLYIIVYKVYVPAASVCTIKIYDFFILFPNFIVILVNFWDGKSTKYSDFSKSTATAI